MRVGVAPKRLGRVGALSALAAALIAVASGPGISSASSPAPFPSAALSAAVQYVGGTAGAANPDLSPISIGWVSDQTAITGHPGNQAGVDAAVDFVNDNLGGIKGHPLKLVTCDITLTDSQGAQCAQQMLDNSSVQVVLEGELLTGEASFTGTMAGTKPVVGVFTNGPGITAKNSFYLDGAIQGELASVPYLAKIVKAKTVAIIGPNLPGVSSALGMFKKLFGALGVTATLELYPPAATDLVGPITASGAESADGVFVVSSTPGECIALAKAFTQLSVSATVVSLPACLETAVKQGLGDYPDWTYVFTSDNPLAPYAPGSDTAAFVAAMARYSSSGLMNSGYAPLTFGTVLTVVKWINQLGPANYTSAAIAQKAASFTGPMFMGDPHIKFGVPPFPTLGSIRALFYTYHGHNDFTAAAGGQWICPPVPTCHV